MKGTFLNASIALTVAGSLGFACSTPETGIIANQAGTGGSGGSPSAGSGGAPTPSVGGGGTTSAGTAGSGGSAGMSLGGGGSGGQAGQGGSAGSAASCCAGGDCKDCLSNMDGWVTKAECGMSQVNHDCDLPGCTNNTKTFASDFVLAGAAADPAKNFTITFNVRGVVECKTYNGGMNRIGSNATQSPTGVNLFYAGGSVPGSSYNTHELHVEPKNDVGPSDWYLNACPTGFSEQHYTWLLDYEETIKVKGGSTIHYLSFDSNCREIQNCGAGAAPDTSCTGKQWVVPLDGMVPAVDIDQPLTVNGAGYGQFLAIDVTKIEVAP